MPADERTLNLLRREPDRRPLPVARDTTSGLEALGPGDRPPTPVPFSVFVASHQARAMELTAEMMEIARRESLEAAVARAERAADEESIELAQHATMVFITHFPPAQRLPLESLEERRPEEVLPSSEPRASSALEALGASGDEAALDWYREDADANAHHERWHVVYPTGGVPDPNDPFGPRRLKDRQGELFVYMHQQMLARYDAERLCAGLGPVEPLFDYQAPLPEGYAPELPGFDAREPGALMSDSTWDVPMTALATWDRRLFGDVVQRDATLRTADGGSVPVTPDRVGDVVESNRGSVNPGFYGSLHNMGHMVLALIPDPNNQGQQRGGVMRATSVAIRDPIFYRWHRHVDDLLFEWQEQQDERGFDDAPDVRLRNSLVVPDDGDALGGGAGPGGGADGSGAGGGLDGGGTDGGVADGSEIGNGLAPAAEPDGRSPDLAIVLDRDLVGDPVAFGEEHFGGEHWDRDPADSGVATDELGTTMQQRQVAGNTLSWLDHDDFHYFLRVENPLAAEQTVTVRLFLVPLEWAEERRQWIELDKFQQTLAPGRQVVARSSRLSSVVRKPARRPGDPPPAPEQGQDPNYCDCGWPYHLLLPRGTVEGLPVRLLAVLTAWDLDRVEVEGKCGSMSFCGKRDTAYPDRRPMGYPFDHRWPGGELARWIREQPNMAARDLVIRAT